MTLEAQDSGGDLVTPSANTAQIRNAVIIAHLRATADFLDKAAQDNPDLPELLIAGITTDGVTLTPWLAGAPVSALRAYEALLEGVITRSGHPLTATHGNVQVTTLRSTGQIGALRVSVTGDTYRPVTTDAMWGVTEQTLAALAAQETPVVTAPGVVLPAGTYVAQADEEQVVTVEIPEEDSGVAPGEDTSEIQK